MCWGRYFDAVFRPAMLFEGFSGSMRSVKRHPSGLRWPTRTQILFSPGFNFAVKSAWPGIFPGGLDQGAIDEYADVAGGAETKPGVASGRSLIH